MARFVHYGKNDHQIDRGDMNKRAGALQSLFRSSLTEGITTPKGIISRKRPGNSPNLRVAQVREDGIGDAGDDSSDCTFQYNVFDFDGEQIGAGLVPKFYRFSKTTYTKAPDDSFGLVFTDPDDVLVLLIAFEENPTEVTCP